MRQIVRSITALIGLFMVVLGVWAFVDARSFYDQIATYPPYNVHLLHDIGSFQIAIGFTLLYALIRRDGLKVALVGASVGNVMHAVAHIIDRDLGGKTTDPIVLSLVAIVTVAITAVYLSQRER